MFILPIRRACRATTNIRPTWRLGCVVDTNTSAYIHLHLQFSRNDMGWGGIEWIIKEKLVHHVKKPPIIYSNFGDPYSSRALGWMPNREDNNKVFAGLTWGQCTYKRDPIPRRWGTILKATWCRTWEREEGKCNLEKCIAELDHKCEKWIFTLQYYLIWNPFFTLLCYLYFSI